MYGLPDNAVVGMGKRMRRAVRKAGRVNRQAKVSAEALERMANAFVKFYTPLVDKYPLLQNKARREGKWKS